MDLSLERVELIFSELKVENIQLDLTNFQKSNSLNIKDGNLKFKNKLDIEYLNELKSNNVQNHVFDSTFYTYKQQLEFILEKQPKAVAIYTNLMTKINVIKL